MTFINTSWPSRIRGDDARAMPFFSTEIVTTDGGHEQRNERWAYPRLRFEFSMPPNRYSEADLATVEHLWYRARGPVHSFLFHYWRDTPAVDEVFGLGDGVTTVFQLARNYPLGGAAAARRVGRPRAGVVVKVDGVVAAPAIDYATGVVTFAAAPAAAAVLTWSGENDVEVRFENDTLDFIPRGGRIAVESVSLLEVWA